MKKNTLLYLIIILLVGFNGYFIANQFKGPPGKNKRGPERFITTELNFDEDQMAQFDALFQPHDQGMRALGREKKELKGALFNMMFEAETPQSSIDSILNKIGDNEQARDLMVFRHFREVKKICNEAQRKKFERIVLGALHRNGPPPRK